jgi:hypothetical protein
MTGKLTLMAGFGAGYVLGARSGRARYDQMMEKAQRLWNHPQVQEKAGQAQQLIKAKTSGARDSGVGPVSTPGAAS